jgi:hypothetical protein
LAGCGDWKALEANEVADRTPDQGTGGFGGRQRREPVGGGSIRNPEKRSGLLRENESRYEARFGFD